MNFAVSLHLITDMYDPLLTYYDAFIFTRW
jgi:hypothetical protein